VEEGIVRVEYLGVYELGDIGRIGLGFVTWGARGSLFKTFSNGLKGKGCVGTDSKISR
jgi:hypothetical protein